MLRGKSDPWQHKLLCVWRDICTVHPTSCKSKLGLMLWMAHSYNVKNSTYPLRSHSRKWLENRMKMFLLAWKDLLAEGEQENQNQAVTLKLPVTLEMLGNLLHHFWLWMRTYPIHANMQVHFRKVRKNYCVWEFRGRIAAVAGRLGNIPAKTPPYST